MNSYEDDANEDQAVNNRVKQFQQDFIRGGLAFLAIAGMVKGDDRDAEMIFNEMMDPIVGNRNRGKTNFDVVMPELFEKIVAYCSEAVTISEHIEKKEYNI